VRVESLWKEFRAFLLRGNIIDLAIAVVLGTAFGVVVKALITDILTPIIALIFGQPDFESLSFTINSSHFFYGDFINAVITFLSVAVAIFFFVVKPVTSISAARARGAVDPESDTRPCTECLSEIPKLARRCAYCTAPQEPTESVEPAPSVA
jgi:large conductance mechanosensitive channel